MVQLVDELPEVDHPNEAIVGRLFVHGGLAHATVGGDGVMRAAIAVPENEYIWRPAIIVMPRGGILELDFSMLRERKPWCRGRTGPRVRGNAQRTARRTRRRHGQARLAAHLC